MSKELAAFSHHVLSRTLLLAYEQRTILLINHIEQGGHDQTQSQIHKDSEMTFLSISRE